MCCFSLGSFMLAYKLITYSWFPIGDLRILQCGNSEDFTDGLRWIPIDVACWIPISHSKQRNSHIISCYKIPMRFTCNFSGMDLAGAFVRFNTFFKGKLQPCPTVQRRKRKAKSFVTGLVEFPRQPRRGWRDETLMERTQKRYYVYEYHMILYLY